MFSVEPNTRLTFRYNGQNKRRYVSVISDNGKTLLTKDLRKIWNDGDVEYRKFKKELMSDINFVVRNRNKISV